MTALGSTAVDPYDELGVAPDATAPEIRAAYLRLAREFHPDHLAESARSAGSGRMARLNAAWEVLGDPARRAAFDATTEPRPAAHVRDPGPTWTPLDGDDGDADLDDTPTGAAAPPRLVAIVPACLFGLGVVLAVVGLIVDIGPMAAAGAGLVIAAGVAFVAIPVVTMIGAARTERDW